MPWIRKVLAVLAGVFACLPGAAGAHSFGIASTEFLESSPASCNACHSGGVEPAVAVSADRLAIDPGQQIVLTVTVTTVNGEPGAAGFNLRASQPGTFAIGGPDAASTRTIVGENDWLEGTHSARKLGEPATFTMLWTPAESASGTITFTAWGNAVDETAGRLGDLASSATLGVSVCSTSWHRDLDGDGFGSAASGTITACAALAGYVEAATDCDDGDTAVRPGAFERCNGRDDDCDAGVDEESACLSGEGGAGGSAVSAAGGAGGVDGVDGSSEGGSSDGGSSEGSGGASTAGASGGSGANEPVAGRSAPGSEHSGGSSGGLAGAGGEHAGGASARGGTLSDVGGAGSAAGAAPDEPVFGTGDDGCGCRIPVAKGSPDWLLGTVFVAFALVRRRRR